MPEIRDSVHRDVLVDPLEIEIIDTPQFQRLRWLSQLPTAQFVYPGATHSRFSHAIGVMELATKIFRELKPLDREDESAMEDQTKWSGIRTYLRVASLLHDIETPPYYPVFHEHYVVKDLLADLKRRYVKAVCENLKIKDVDPDIVLAILEGKDEFRYLSQIIDSEVGANRLDYLMRDAYYCGVNYGSIDSRIVYEFYYHAGEIVLRKEALPLVDTVFNAMFQMKINVYDHRISRLLARMLYDAVEKSLEHQGTKLTDYLQMNDHELFQQILKNDPESANRIRNRDLPKTAFVLDATSSRDPDLVPKYFEHNYRHEKGVIEDEIQRLAHGAPVVVDFVTLRNPASTPIKAKINDSQVRLVEVPILKKWYDKQPFEQWKMFVFCDPAKFDPVKKVCETVFGPLEIGREDEERTVIDPLKDLYDQLDRTESSEIKQRSIKSMIFDLPKHELVTLRALDALGSATADDVRIRTERDRATESLMLNRLVKEKLAVKAKQGRKVYFTLTTASIVALRELTGIADASQSADAKEIEVQVR
jgi:HD superfamily phosphohydrolase